MAEKMLKIVQDGRESFIPDNQRNRSFWTKQNSKVAGSQNAQRELVTILQAKPEEVEALNQPNAVSTQNFVAPVVNPELDALKQQVAQMQDIIAKFIQPAATEPVKEEKNKPGPKPKTDKDGESETKDTAKA